MAHHAWTLQGFSTADALHHPRLHGQAGKWTWVARDRSEPTRHPKSPAQPEPSQSPARAPPTRAKAKHNRAECGLIRECKSSSPDSMSTMTDPEVHGSTPGPMSLFSFFYPSTPPSHPIPSPSCFSPSSRVASPSRNRLQEGQRVSLGLVSRSGTLFASDLSSCCPPHVSTAGITEHPYKQPAKPSTSTNSGQLSVLSL